MAIRDSIHHPRYAAHGYASVRVDIRGSGDSDGVLQDEYTLQEQDDGMEIIAKADGRTPPEVGNTVNLGAAPENIHIFDPETGVALR